MNVYISCHDKAVAHELSETLSRAGHRIVSTWHEEDAPRPGDDDAAAWAKKAKDNCTQIDGASAFVLVASPEHLSRERCVPGGKFVEAGYAINHALGSGGPLVFTVGGVENGMLHHPVVRHVATVDTLLSLLSKET